MNSSFFSQDIVLLSLYCNEFNVALFSHLLNNIQNPFQKVTYFVVHVFIVHNVVYFVATQKD